MPPKPTDDGPTRIPEDRLARVRLLLLDVDGVLTDGKIIYDDRGSEIKAFHVRDGLGMKMLIASGVGVGVVTGVDDQVVGEAEVDVRHVTAADRYASPGVAGSCVVVGGGVVGRRRLAELVAHADAQQRRRAPHLGQGLGRSGQPIVETLHRMARGIERGEDRGDGGRGPVIVAPGAQGRAYPWAGTARSTARI